MKLGPPIFILAVGASTLAHIIGVALLIETTKKNASFYQEKITLTLLPSSTVPVESNPETPKPLSASMDSNSSVPLDQWSSFTQHPTLVDPETSIAPVPPPSQKRTLVQGESTIQTIASQPQQALANSRLEARAPIKLEGKSVINKPIEAGTHIAISKPSTGPSILQTHHHFLHEDLSNPSASPPLLSSSTEAAVSQTTLALDHATQTPQQIPLIVRNESIAEYQLEELGNQRPRYPRTARKQGVEGRVILSVIVASSGLPKHISVFESSGAEMLDYAAVSAIEKWNFIPAKIRAKPVDSKLLISIRFQLEN